MRLVTTATDPRQAAAEPKDRIRGCSRASTGGLWEKKVRLNFLSSELQSAGLPAPWYAAWDARDTLAYQALLRRVASELGAVTVLVNNVGRDDRHAMEDVTPEMRDERLSLNLKHYFFAIQAVALGMATAGGVSVINMGSVSWMRGRPNLVGYTTTKAGILGLTRTLARQLGPRNNPRQWAGAGRHRHRAPERAAPRSGR